MNKVRALHIRLLTLIIWAFFWSSSQGSPLETMEQKYAMALTEHPSLRSLASAAAYHQALATKALSLPDPQLMIGVENVPFSNPAFDRFLPTSKSFGFSQNIPNKAGRQAQSKIQTAKSQTQALIGAYQLEKLAAQFLSERTKYWANIEQQKHIQQQIRLFNTLEDNYKGQLAAGKSSFGQLSLVDVEKASLELEISTLESEKVSSTQKLIALVGEIPPVVPPKTQLFPWDQAQHQLYPLSIAASRQQEAKASLDEAQASFKPNFGFQGTYKQRESSDQFNGDDWFSVQATISIPLWASSRQTPQKEAALHQINASLFQYEDTQKTWIAQMLSIQASHKSAAQNVQLLLKKQRAIQRIIDTARREYEAGNITLNTVVEAQINLHKIRANLVRQQARQGLLAADYNSHIFILADQIYSPKSDQTDCSDQQLQHNHCQTQ